MSESANQSKKYSGRIVAKQVKSVKLDGNSDAKSTGTVHKFNNDLRSWISKVAHSVGSMNS